MHQISRGWIVPTVYAHIDPALYQTLICDADSVLAWSSSRGLSDSRKVKR